MNAPTHKRLALIGGILGIVACVLLTFSAAMKFVSPQQVTDELARLGYDAKTALPLGAVELACTILYLWPRTAVLGAILLTGYLGGATATHVRIGDAFFMPPIIGAVLWLGLFLRDSRLRSLIPLRSTAA